jgi:23S rRNA (cytidine1920-2'-O)/16S rRNA (cytidine1409-2'-O)-methyltransferase
MRRELLSRYLDRLNPPITDADAALREHRVTVNGAVVTNPSSFVRSDARVVVAKPRKPRGVEKLGHALDAFAVEVSDACAVDLGACTGGFTMALLERGASHVFAVDAGFGQLLGSLQQDPRVTNLERTNVAQVTPKLLRGVQPDLIVADVTKLALRELGIQIVANGLPREGTRLVGLVKPMFELGTGQLPTGRDLEEALDVASSGLATAGWITLETMRSEVLGQRGAVEFFIYAEWRSGVSCC